MDGVVPIEVLRINAPGVILGLLILIAGCLSLLLFLLRPRPRDTALLYFALASGLYGIRLIAISPVIRQAFPGLHVGWDWINWIVDYTIFIPFTFFFLSTVAPEWKKAEWWIVTAAAGIAVFGIASRILGADLTAIRIYNIEVILYLPLLAIMLFLPRRRADRQLWVMRVGFLTAVAFAVYTNLVELQFMPGRKDLEPLGFLVFLCCQAYVAADQTFRNEQRLVAINKELEIARGIQLGLLPDPNVAFPGLDIAARYLPASSVAGDFYHFANDGGHGLGVLVADVSGHGVPAALSASMVKVAMHAQSARIQDPSDVLAGLNATLCGNLQGQFVTAAYAFIDVAKHALTYAGAGHPPVLLWRGREAKVTTMEENGMILGLFPGCSYKAQSVPFEASDRCLLYTDGVIEAPNPAGEEYGSERLQRFVADNASASASAFCDRLMAEITDWRGRTDGNHPHDDMTVVAIDLK